MSNITCTERKSAPKESAPLIDIKLNQNRDDIPLKKDWSNRNCIMTACYKDYIEQALNFPVLDDDVYIITMPKCGTTWMQATAWLVLNDFDFETANKTPILKRSPHVE